MSVHVSLSALETRLFPHKTLSLGDCLLREDAGEDILSRFGVFVLEKSKGRSVFAEAMIQVLFLVPSVVCIVDLVVDFGIGKVQLARVTPI